MNFPNHGHIYIQGLIFKLQSHINIGRSTYCNIRLFDAYGGLWFSEIFTQLRIHSPIEKHLEHALLCRILVEY